jgi:integrase
MIVMRHNKVDLKPNTKLRDAVSQYTRSSKFAQLSGAVQGKYDSTLQRVCATKVQNGAELGNIKLSDIRFKHVTYAYDRWSDNNGPSAANYMATCLSIVLNTAIRHEAILANPVTQLQRKTEKPRRVKWSKDDVKSFLTTAYSEWRWRSIGLILHMAYEWGQRIGDMRLLKWEDIDFEAQRVDITQSKRGAEVHLPVPDELLAMLEAQRVDFGFQDYVAPRVKPNHSGYSPYTAIEIHTQVNNIKAKAGLDPKLQARDLRRTAITEMAEAGVDLVGIMQVSGHQNPNSVKPYLVNTFSGASAALSKRKGNE